MKPKISKFSIGADVEMFLRNLQTGEFLSAEGYIPGSKQEPFNFDASNPYFAVSLDNVAAEFCIPPVTSPEDWERFLMKGVEYINKLAPMNAKCVASPAAYFDDKYLQTPNARLFGCEPDYCVWIQDINPKPEAADSSLRSAGGHIHIGHNVPENDAYRLTVDESLVKAMDIFVGIPSVIIEPANKRKELYGKAGCFRFKPYGIEYRTVSNFYMDSAKLRRWVFDNTVRAIDFVNHNEMDDLVSPEEGRVIMETINNADVDSAYRLVEKYNIPIC